MPYTPSGVDERDEDELDEEAGEKFRGVRAVATVLRGSSPVAAAAPAETSGAVCWSSWGASGRASSRGDRA